MKAVAEWVETFMEQARERAKAVEERNRRILAEACPACPGPYRVDLRDMGVTSAPCPLYAVRDEVCRYVRRENEERLWRSLGVPERYWTAEWGQAFKGKEVRRRLIPALRRGRGAVILGHTGTGKSCLLALILRAAAEAGLRGRMISAHDLLDFRAVDGVEDVPVLGIDDLGVVPWPGAAARARWDRLVDYRYARKLPIVVTSNLEPAEFRDFVGERAWDRIRETCWFIWIPGESRRRPEAEVKDDDGA
jgi:DNA replication protein DnaC